MDVNSIIDAARHSSLERTSLCIGTKFEGKVRDVYTLGEHIVLVTTDRLSAFDRVLAAVPFKGAVLNLTSAWWFEKTAHIIPNHVVSVPHPNVTVAKRLEPFKCEVIVRAFLTGTTSTSIWTHYKDGARTYCGHALPDGLAKNSKLPHHIVTPTTKDDAHDRPISGAEVVSGGMMTAAQWEYVSAKALELFAFGVAEAAARGLILVDTKYEFGTDAAGVIHIMDEMHTPDSSRYWLAESFAERIAAGQEPANVDKEFLRIWFRDHCDPYADAPLPAAPPELVVELSRRYISLYESITGCIFPLPAAPAASSAALAAAIHAAVQPLFPAAPLRVLALPAAGGSGSGGGSCGGQSTLDAVLVALPEPVPAAPGTTAGVLERTLVAVERCAAATGGAAGAEALRRMVGAYVSDPAPFSPLTVFLVASGSDATVVEAAAVVASASSFCTIAVLNAVAGEASCPGSASSAPVLLAIGAPAAACALQRLAPRL